MDFSQHMLVQWLAGYREIDDVAKGIISNNHKEIEPCRYPVSKLCVPTATQLFEANRIMTKRQQDGFSELCFQSL